MLPLFGNPYVPMASHGVRLGVMVMACYGRYICSEVYELKKRQHLALSGNLA